MNFKIEPRAVLITLLTTVALLVAANTAALILKYQFNTQRFRIVLLGEEQNIPTLYSSITLFIAGMLLAVIAVASRRASQSATLWGLLACIFGFLSLDEFAMLHERLILPVRGALDTSGAFFFAWVIPYGIGLIGMLALYSKFLWQLPRRTMKLFVGAGSLFVGGAVGIEMLEGAVHEAYGFGAAFQTCQTVEEMFEMIGVAIFIYALLDYMTVKFGSVTVTVDGSVE